MRANRHLRVVFLRQDKYNIMFGPDICGYDKKTHVIFAYNGENHLVKKKPKCAAPVREARPDRAGGLSRPPWSVGPLAHSPPPG